MKKTVLAVLVIGLLMFGMVGMVNATIINIDADGNADMTDISTTFSGVTLSATGTGFGGTNDGKVYAVDPLIHGEPFNASTGSMVFGHSGSFASLWQGWSSIQLRADFGVLTDFVSLDIISNDSSDAGWLKAFATDGTLLGQYTTSWMSTSNFETASLNSSSSNIAYIIAGGLNGSSIGLDNLNYSADPIPEPSTFLLLGAGLAGLGFFARRRKQA